MKTMFRRIYLLGALLIVLISTIFMMQYSYMNSKIIKNKEVNIEKSTEILGQEINSQLKHYSQAIELTAIMINANNWSKDEVAYNLTQIYEKNPVFSLIYYGSVNGDLISAIDWEMTPGYAVKTRPWYTKALEEGVLTYSGTYVDALTGRLAMSISKPIYDENNQLRGVIAGDILIDEIIALVNKASADVTDTGYSFLIDSKGNILAHPDYIYEDYLDLKNIDQVSPLLFEDMKKNRYGKKPLVIDEIDGYLSYQPIENTDWIIGSFASLSEYNANNKYLFRILAVALLSALLILGVFLILQNRYVVKPLKRLVEDIEQVAVQKDTAYRVKMDKRDSFAAPRQSVNNILEKTEDYFKQQQAYSEELTASYEELEAQNQQLYELSNYDHLTKLYNRRFFEDNLKRLDKKENLPLGIIMADVNGLKLVNDSFGHKAGDELLKETGKTLREGCPDGELVYRIGGDEFVIILPKTNPAQAQMVIKQIKNLTKQVSLHNIKLSISFGVGFKYEEAEDVAGVLKKAEDDMYSNKLVEGPSMRSKTIDTIVHTLYEKNPREEAHSSRVSTICQQIGVELKMSEHQIKQLKTVGLLHDIGKIAVSNEILEKQGALTKEEWEEISRHPEIGYRILGTTSEMAQIAEYALSHHERYDGAGYPQGLKGEEIPLVSRIITIADAYDAMVSDRPYRKGLPEEVIVEEIIKNAGTQFDPDLAKLFVEKILNKEWKNK